MKILSPVDFSATSINACNWIVRFLEKSNDNHTLVLAHCINNHKKVIPFNKYEDVEEEMAERNIDNLIFKLRKLNKNIKFEWIIVREEPSFFLVDYAQKNDFDWIVVGTKGLTNAKDLTVGSVTDYCVKNSNKPVFAIPPLATFDKIETILLGVEDDLILDTRSLNPIFTIDNLFRPKILLTHVNIPHEKINDISEGLQPLLQALNTEYHNLQLNNTISDTLSSFSKKMKVDLICIMHRKRGWVSRIFHKSISKERLFGIERPTLILQD